MKHATNVCMLLIITVSVLCSCSIILTSCNTSRKISKGTEEVKTLIDEGYTPDQVKEMRELNKDESIMDKLMSERILLLFAVGALILIFGGAFCLYSGKPGGAVGCFVSAAVVMILPVLVVVFLKAMTFLLYVFCGIVIIAVVVGLFMLYRKYSTQNVAFKSVVGTVEDMKSAYPAEWDNYKGQVDQTTEVKAEVKKAKKGKKK
jgi:hypothetical protein